MMPNNEFFDYSTTTFFSISINANIYFKVDKNIKIFSGFEYLKAVTPIYYKINGYDGTINDSDYLKYYKISLGFLYALKK
jgi:hypothetical protein